MARKARIEGATADPVTIKAAIAEARGGSPLQRIMDEFQSEYPEEWAVLRLCPLQHGLEAMIEKLKG